MELKELRKKWEKGQDVDLCVTDSIDDTTLVVTSSGIVERTYRTYRYFKVNNEWQVSIDYDGDDIVCALEKVTKQFADINDPK